MEEFLFVRYPNGTALVVSVSSIRMPSVKVFLGLSFHNSDVVSNSKLILSGFTTAIHARTWKSTFFHYHSWLQIEELEFPTIIFLFLIFIRLPLCYLYFRPKLLKPKLLKTVTNFLKQEVTTLNKYLITSIKPFFLLIIDDGIIFTSK